MCGVIIGFSRAKDNTFPIASWLIQWVEHRPYSHVYIRWYDPWVDENIVFEARGTTVHLVSFHRFCEECEVVEEFRIELHDENIKKQIIRYAFDTIESKYSFIQLVGIGIVKIFKNCGRTISNPFGDRNRGYICSELVARLLKEVLNVPITEDLDSISPSDLHKIVERLGKSNLSQ